MAYDLDAIKRKLKEYDGRKSDPDEFRPAKAEKNKSHSYRFYILPGLQQGDKLKSGIVNKSMDLFFISYAQHWVKNAPHACPKVWDGSECDLCDFGFKLLRDKNLSEDERKKIRMDWLPSQSYAVNIYFPSVKANPEELRGRVMYYKAPRTLFDMWTACINRDAPENIEDEDEGFSPHGIFYDENAAWLFELNVELNGKSNGYKSSKFVYGASKKPTPIVKNDRGLPDVDAIEKVLAQRIDIWQRLDVPDRAKIKKLSQVLLHGDDEDIKPGFDVDEEDEKPLKRPAKALHDEEDEEPKKADKTAKKQQQDLFDEAEEPPKKVKIDNKAKAEDDDDLSSLLEQLDDD